MAKVRVIVIDGKDNVAIALEPLKRGTEILTDIQGAAEKITLLSDIPLGHKFALRNMRKGDPVIKYGQPIGQSKRKIARGEHVHVHNVGSMQRLKRRRR
jgi:altronate dehydratase small subunit